MPKFVSQCSGVFGGIRTLRGSLVPGQGEIFLISLKSHHWKDYVFLKKWKTGSRFSGLGEEI